MKNTLLFLLTVAFLAFPPYKSVLSKTYNYFFSQEEIEHPSDAKIQIALLLDTSNSMDGLITQAKTQLWKMVNELSSAHRGGDHPTVEIALYHYGNSGLSGESYFIKKLTPLTNDLDLVSEKLFSLSTNGGNEYCGAVIKASLDELEWTNAPKDLRLILIAGNEAFTQGPISYEESCKYARKKGVQINTIFCGDFMEGKLTNWEAGAKLAEGKYLNIDQDRQITSIPTPYDEQIIQLNIRLNKTYLGYGSKGTEYKKRQAFQDSNAAQMSPSAVVERSMVKAKPTYNNANWDLVDAVEMEVVDMEEIAEDSLPEEMKSMDNTEKTAFLNKMKKEREELQEEISDLGKKVKEFRATHSNSANENTLDEVLINAVKEQARSKKFELE